MIEFIDKVLQKLTPYIPLMQSLIWPFFIGILIYVFREQFKACINAIESRIDRGSSVEAGPFKLGELPKATAKERTDKINEEVNEIDHNADTSDEATEDGEPEKVELVTSAPRLAKKISGIEKQNKRGLRASYILAEDLAMTKISNDLGFHIEREVWDGADKSFMFDGVALVGEKFIAIEVKLIQGEINPISATRHSLEKLNHFYMTLGEDGKKCFSVIIAIVFDQENQTKIDSFENVVTSIKSQFEFPVDARTYKMSLLESEFSIN